MKKIFFALLALVLLPAQARADLTITPTRVVFQGRDRSAVVQLLNMTDRTNTYRMNWMLLKPTDKGGYDMVQATPEMEKDPHSVANMVIFSPRQVTIGPHGQQVIRLMLRRPADLPPGEYRAHMSMTRLAKNAADQPDPDAKTVGIEMNVNLGFSIPIIVRQGDDPALKVSLTSPALEQKGNRPVLKVDLHRDAGSFSTYGTVRVLWKKAGETSEREIGSLTNVTLYPELATRHVFIPLRTKEPINSGTIRLVYEGKLEAEGTTWAENSFPVGK